MALFESLSEQFMGGSLSAETHCVAADRLQEFPEDRLRTFDSLGPDDGLTGLEHLKGGHWARLVLNGGMATRFGGRVKGICEVYDGRTFLELKLAHMRRLEKDLGLPEIPVVLMNSPATHEPTMDFLRSHDFFGRQGLSAFVQETFPRLCPDGTVFAHSEGKGRAPRGHGDFLEGLRDSKVLETWVAAGISHFDFSNIDNLGATIEPRLVGAFLKARQGMAIELARKNPGDKGGAACLRDGVAGVLEGIYFDDQFDQDRLPWFNTNNLMFSVAGAQALLDDEQFSFPWNVVSKDVEGSAVIQFERIAIDAVWGFNSSSEHDEVLFFGVPREGEDGRFYPVKSPDDLVTLQEPLRQRLGV